MRSQLLKLNTFFENLPDRVRKYPKSFWALFLLITISAFAGLPRFKIDMSWDAMFQNEEPVKIAYDRFRAVFGSDENLYLVYEAKDGDVFSGNSLSALSNFQSELEKLRTNSKIEDSPFSHITDVTSLINVSFLEGDSTSLISRDFVGSNIPNSKTDSDVLRELALNHPNYPKLFCSDDSRYGAILIRTDFNAEIIREDSDLSNTPTDEFDFESDNLENYLSPLDGKIPKFKSSWIQGYVPFYQAMYKLIEKPEYSQYLTFHPAGNPELMGFLGVELEKEMGIIILGSIILILVVLGLLMRSFKIVLWTLLIIISTLVWTIGSMGWSGYSMSDFINIVIFLLIAVGVADAVHLFSGYFFFRRNGEDHDVAIRSVYKKSGFACFLTSLTTSAGILALYFAPIIAVQRLAVFGALGVMFAFLITVIMIPLMLDALTPKIKLNPDSTKKTRIFYSEYSGQV